MAEVKGIDILILVESDVVGTFIPVGGQRSATLSETAETIDATHKLSGGYKVALTSFSDWGIKCEGVYVTDDAAYEKLITAKRAKTKVKLRWSENGTDILEGDAVITSRELEGSYDAEATYSMEFMGSGPITVLP